MIYYNDKITRFFKCSKSWFIIQCIIEAANKETIMNLEPDDRVFIILEQSSI